jgi:EAL domain-containing protein (putative c-di-GMP-specific phosphodiesterase class I)
MSNCHRCDPISESPAGASTLYLRVPAGYLGDKLRSLAEQATLCWEELEPGVFSLSVSPDKFPPLLDLFESDFTPREREIIRCTVVAAGEHLSSAEPLVMSSLGVSVAQLRNAWITDLLAQKRLFSAFQPIVRTSEGKSVGIFGHECLLRGYDSDGTFISPVHIFESARAADLLFQLDTAARRSSIECAAARGLRNKIFINFNPTTIYDPATCLRSTLELIDEKGLPRDQIVFEVVESEQIADTAHLRRILDYYRAEGFTVALDDVGAGFNSLRLLSEIRPDFIKIDMDLIRNVHEDKWKAIITSHLIEVAHELSLPIIAEGIECIEESQWLEERRVQYQQGFLHGRPEPRPLPSQVPVKIFTPLPILLQP